jgi:predicted Zn-dependent protease with MMP-like domain
MTDKEFDSLVSEAINTLPQEFLEKLENVSVVTQDSPDVYQKQKLGIKRGGLLLGLYEGIPKTRRGRYGIGPTLPDKITIFKIPILMISHTYDEVKNQVRDTVMHEIAHHFGMSEEDIRRTKH